MATHNIPLTANTNTNLGGNNEIMMIESQDVDMNSLQDQAAFPFSFDGDFIPWLEYLPPDVMSYFGEHQGYRPMMDPDDDGGGGRPAPSV